MSKVKLVGETQTEDVKYNGDTAPCYSTEGSAGGDLRSAEECVIHPRETVKIKTGLKMAIPDGLVGMVCPRSGMAANFYVTVANAPGIIDSDYRGEVCVLLINHGTDPYIVMKGAKVAQLVLVPFVQGNYIAGDLDDTDRGEGGFGSTGH